MRLTSARPKNKDGREFIYRDTPDLKRFIDQQWAAHEALQKADKPILSPLVFHRHGKPIKSYRKALGTAL